MNRVENAVKMFKSGYNCTQGVVCAYCDIFGVDEEIAARMAEGFGGGMGRMRLTCGAVSGMVMLAGMKKSKGTKSNIQSRTELYELVRAMAGEFKEKNGSIICGELLGLSKPKDESAKPEERTEDYYKRRPCIGCVEDCARIVEEYLLNDE